MSARVFVHLNGSSRPPSSEEEDNLKRSTKKIKGNDIPSPSSRPPDAAHKSDINMEEVPSPLSYKEHLINAFGDSASEDEVWGETEAEFPKKWYNYDEIEGRTNPKPFVAQPEVPFTDEELEAWSVPWRNTLIVSVLGKKVSLKMLENKLQRIWTKNGPITVTDLAGGFFLVRLSSQEDYKHALFEGPWKVADHYLIVQRWRPLFSFSAANIRKIAVWVRIPGLPLELCNDSYLRRIGATIGTMLRIDKLTSLHSRGKFARISVEIDLD